MMMDDEKEFGLREKYEYELPGKPVNPSDDPLGKSFFTHPSNIPVDVKPYNPDGMTQVGHLKYWFIACAVVLVLGLTFEFGLLGKDGKEGPLCQYLPKNKMCYYLAGPAPVSTVIPTR